MPSFELEVKTFTHRYNRLHNMISTSSPPPNQKDIVGQHTRSLRSDFNPNDKDFFDSETQRSFQPISNEGLQLLKISDADTTEVQSTLDIPNFDLILQDYLAYTSEDFHGGNKAFLFSTSGLFRDVDTTS
ncbi:uncharacterized protein N7487_003472 [Penicillium crustosum]|uniref:uncharacterized protein n=1 Tax=Penicillium crustosum TaxID=36656 RepID=UPI0023A03A31|nr:uncharacterized protein N7487_003472 [Penicillium crustosum]KAJ5419922.1 hypothetical protein N7487_003472 [Penicillium crustosum]